jgi:hypothetical protein
LLTKFIKLTLLLLGICVLSAAPVFADTTTFNFLIPTGNLLANSHTYSANGLSLTAFGFEHNFSATPASFLFSKNAGPGEMGLGLAGGIDNEISNLCSTCTSFISLNIGGLLASAAAKGVDVLSVTLNIDSITGIDAYHVRGGPANNTLGNITYVAASTSPTFDVPISGPTARPFVNIATSTTGTNGQSILLESVTVTTTPEPSSAGLLLIGFGALVAAGTLGKKLIA